MSASDLTDRLQTHRRMRTAHGATLAELTLLAEVGESLARAQEREAGLREALALAVPMLKAGVKYDQQRAHAAHALPGSRERSTHELSAGMALYELRRESVQAGARAALAAAGQEGVEG